MLRSRLPLRFTAPIALVALCVGCGAKPVAPILISEIVPSNKTSITEDERGKSLRAKDATLPDWLELYNPTNEDVVISNWHLTDDLANDNKWTFPDDTEIKAGKYLIVYLSGKKDQEGLFADFRVQITGDTIALIGPDRNDRPVVDSLEFGPVASDYSWARLPDSNGDIDENTPFVITWPPTPGEVNRLDPQPDFPGGAP